MIEENIETILNKTVAPHVHAVYETRQAREILKKLVKEVTKARREVQKKPHLLTEKKWDSSSAMLITYADSVQGDGSPLQSLGSLLSMTDKELSLVHLLPFFPYTSDDGFSVSDYLTVNPDVGTWEDVEALSKEYGLMIDFVVNHLSAEHQWFKDFQAGRKQDFFIEIDPESDDLSAVTRPRSSSLFRPVTCIGRKTHVWATFSHDQIDLDFSSPAVFLEFARILIEYLKRGGRYIRLDAVGFLWKEKGTSCMHLPQTHSLIKAMRHLAETVNPGSVIITETNVPHQENISYFGKGDEAHVVYNFSLPPMILHAFLYQSATRLVDWLQNFDPLPAGCTTLNILSTHDGIGLRPAEGLIPDSELQQMVDRLAEFGGKISMRSKPDGSLSPYEANITFLDALKGTLAGDDNLQVERFLAAHALAFSLPGIPAVYILSLLGLHNDYELLEKTGANRSINRTKVNLHKIQCSLQDTASDSARCFQGILRLLRIRREQPAFAPEAGSEILRLSEKAIMVRRKCEKTKKELLAITNVSNGHIRVALPSACRAKYIDLLSRCLHDAESILQIGPYQSMWLNQS